MNTFPFDCTSVCRLIRDEISYLWNHGNGGKIEGVHEESADYVNGAIDKALDFQEGNQRCANGSNKTHGQSLTSHNVHNCPKTMK